MGFDNGPVAANLCLFRSEWKFVMDLMKQKKMALARKFRFTYRFIDDNLVINNSLFEKYIPDIYPKELVLNKTSSGEEASYLDLLFSKQESSYKISLYDKRDDYSFEIVNYPWLDSNIPESPAYGVYISRLIAYARACESYQDFRKRHQVLVNKLVKQGYKMKKLKVKFGQFISKYSKLVGKYKMTENTMFQHISGEK